MKGFFENIFKGLPTTIIQEIITTAGTKVLSEVKKNIQLQRNIEEVGRFVASYEIEGNEYESVLELVFSRKNMGELTHVIEQSDAYCILKDIENWTDRKMEEYKIPPFIRPVYRTMFLDGMVHVIKGKVPEKYELYLQQEHRDLVGVNFQQLFEQIQQISDLLQRKEQLEIYSINQIDEELKNSTKGPSINLSFFEIDPKIEPKVSVQFSVRYSRLPYTKEELVWR